MSQAAFVARHEPEWRQLKASLDALGTRKKPEKTKKNNGSEVAPQAGDAQAEAVAPASAAEIPALYRRVCQQLALAQSRGYSRTLIDRIEALVLRAHQTLYARRTPLARQFAQFIALEFPRLVRAEWRFVVLAALLFYGPFFAMIGGIALDPEFAFTMMEPAQAEMYEDMYDTDNESRFGRERESDTDLLMFGYYIKHNTSIGFQTFAGGLLFGLGTVFYLFYNGAAIGAVAGHLTAAGYNESFWPFVAGHSAPELTAIVLSGAAGLRVGWALIAPGRYTRRRALLEAGRVSIRIIYGAAALFFVAAFVEAFWSSQAVITSSVKYTAGAIGWCLLLAYLLLPGRLRAA